MRLRSQSKLNLIIVWVLCLGILLPVHPDAVEDDSEAHVEDEVDEDGEDEVDVDDARKQLTI